MPYSRPLALSVAAATIGVCATAYAQGLPPAITDTASTIFGAGGFGAVAVISLVANWVQRRDNATILAANAKLTSDNQAIALQLVQAVGAIDNTVKTVGTTMQAVATELRSLSERIRDR